MLLNKKTVNRRIIICATTALKANSTRSLQDMNAQVELILPEQTLLSQNYLNLFNPAPTIT